LLVNNSKMEKRGIVRSYVAENVDDDDVYQSDKALVRDLICDILEFDPSLPTVKILIKRRGDHYVCMFSGWKNPISIIQFAKRFLLDGRPRKYDSIMQDADIQPEREGEGGPYLTVRILADSKLGLDTEYRRK
jgi:hypothetical protein